LKNDIRYCLGEWEIASLKEERDEDENENENENERFINTSFFFKKFAIFSFGRETIVERFSQNIS